CGELNRPARLGPILHGHWTFLFVRGELSEAQHSADELCLLSEARGDVIWKCFGLIYSGMTYSVLGKFAEARYRIDNALPFCDQRYLVFVSSATDPYLAGLVYLFRTLLCLGHIDQARQRRGQVIAESRRLSPYNLVYARCVSWLGDHVL